MDLYHNNKDGTFTRMTTNEVGPVVGDKQEWICVGWGDANNDGFMDVFVTADNAKNALYRNLGNSNHWIKLQLKGTASNAAALGAKVRVQATVGGKTFWQMREITSGAYSQDDLLIVSLRDQAMRQQRVRFRVAWVELKGAVSDLDSLIVAAIHPPRRSHTIPLMMSIT